MVKLHGHCKRKQYILFANKDVQVKHGVVERISRKITSLSRPKLNFSSIGVLPITEELSLQESGGN
jgi:hypothetical protein